VQVNLSSVAFWQRQHCAVSRKPCALRTQLEHGPWVAVDLGPSGKRILPDHYTLRHGGAGASQPSLRNWVLEGLEEGLEHQGYQVLRRHVNDTSLQGDFASASWAVPAGEAARRRGSAGFRVLRVRDTSPGKSVLHIGGFEVYGTLMVRHSPIASAHP